MKARIEDKNICGIYLIRNKVNGKIYVGKSISIYRRIKDHIKLLNKKDKNENIHLINSWFKHGYDNFDYEIIEKFDNIDEKYISERELYWILFFRSNVRKFGYNLRLDTDTGLIVSEEIRLKLKKSRNLRDIKFPELNKENSIKTKTFWENNPEIKAQMSEKVRSIIQKNYIVQFDRDMNIIHEYKNKKEIKELNPTFYIQAIMGVCQGTKKSYKDFIWRYRNIATQEIIQK